MKAMRNETSTRRRMKAILGVVMTGVLLTTSWISFSGPAAARDRDDRGERSRDNRDGGGRPFGYIDEVDRQRGNQGRLLPGQRIVRVESRNGRYYKEPLNTEGYVRLYRQLSRAPGRQGREWGYDSRGIWVDKGFRAEFVVGRPTARPDDGYDRDRPPSWAIGTFRGHDSARNCDNTLTIRPDGSVRYRSDFRNSRPTVTQTGSYRDGRLRFNGSTLVLERDGGAFRAVEQGGEHSRVTYRRSD